MVNQPTCIACGAQAPNTDTNYTLISATFGWRLTRRVMPDGTRGVEWRCATCWNAQKNAPPAAAKPGARPLGSPRPAAGAPASRLERDQARGATKPSSPPGAR